MTETGTHTPIFSVEETVPHRPVVGIDLGGTNMQIGVVSGDHKVIGSAKRKTKAEQGAPAVLDRIAEGVQAACEQAKVPMDRIGGIGIGAPGPVDPRRGVVLEAVNLRWDDVPLADELSGRLGVPVTIDNDVNVAVMGENRFGAGQNAEHLLGVWVGTGVGGALILNGRMHYGALFSAGEIGHTILLPNAPIGGRTLENVCSRTSVVNRLAQLIASNHPSIITDFVKGDLSKIKSRTLGDAYAQNDALTRAVIDESADLIGIAVANAVTLLSIKRVVLGGGLTEAIGAPYVERVRASAAAHAFPDELAELEVVASTLEDKAGILGAAWIARDRLGV